MRDPNTVARLHWKIDAIQSLPYEGPLIPAPRPEDRTPFVQSVLEDGSSSALPHYGGQSSPMLYSLIDTDPENRPSFSHVSNTSLQRPKLQALVLIGSQSYCVSKAIESFLRRMRDAEEEIQLLIFPIYRWLLASKVEKTDQLEYYLGAKDLVSQKAELEPVMYSEFKHAARVGFEKASEGMAFDDWYLELED
ncbi:MAG: hypothetical protein LQ342_006004 [Letrouitia transgressa]|nr:MAG: hypothetical protein LQ342_006004 [Letrouitia transgressa]